MADKPNAEARTGPLDRLVRLRALVSEHVSMGAREVGLGAVGMPSGYALLLNADESHYFGVRYDGVECDICWDRWAIYRWAVRDAQGAQPQRSAGRGIFAGRPTDPRALKFQDGGVGKRRLCVRVTTWGPSGDGLWAATVTLSTDGDTEYITSPLCVSKFYAVASALRLAATALEVSL